MPRKNPILTDQRDPDHVATFVSEIAAKSDLKVLKRFLQNQSTTFAKGRVDTSQCRRIPRNSVPKP